MGLKRGLSTCIRVLSLALLLYVPATMVSYRSVSAAAGPKTLSDFSLKDVDGKSVKLSSLGGKAYVVDVWATWCPPCKEEIPHLIQLQDKYKDKGLRIVGISVDDDGAAAVKPFMAQQHLNYPVLLGGDPEALGRILGPIDSIPVTLFVNRDHTVRSRMVGYHDPAEMESEIVAMLGDKKP